MSSVKVYKGVYFTELEITKLKKLAKDRGINLSEAIRYVIDKYFDEQPKTEKYNQLNLFNNHE
jgi:macrodomain Ter protein organizer (MatP/YcbG family)